eukprot:1948092-Lingulodinium_polyedra.AAC.1
MVGPRLARAAIDARMFRQQRDGPSRSAHLLLPPPGQEPARNDPSGCRDGDLPGGHRGRRGGRGKRDHG